MSGLIALFCVGLALARDVVVYQGDPVAAAGVASADVGAPAASLQFVRLAELPSVDGAALLGGGAPAFCSSARDGNAAVRELVARAEGHLGYQRTAQARASLDAAASGLRCLSEPLEASLAGRLYFLLGVVALRESGPAEAERAFALAAALQPGLTWDARLPPDETGTFARALAPPAARVEVLPGLGPGLTLWVDGRAATGPVLSLPVGRHYLQVLGPASATTLLVDLEPGTRPVLVTPGWLDRVDLDALDPATQAMVEVALRGTFPDRKVYVVTAGRTAWLADRWTLLPSRRGRTPVCASGRRCAGVALLGGGIAGMAAGGVVFGVAQLRVGALTESPAGETPEAYQERIGAREAAAAWLPMGGALAGVGLASAGVGVLLQRPGVTLTWSGPALVGRF